MEEFDEFDFEEPFDLDRDGSQELEEWEKPEESLVFKIVKWSVAIIVVFGMLNLFGFRNFFLYRTTSPEVEQQEVKVKVDAEILQVPLNVIVLTSRDDGYGSKRDEKSVLSLVENAAKIWEQGGIEIVLKSIHFEEKNNAILGSLYQNPRLVINNVQNFDNESINVFLVGNLGGINGVSFNSLNVVAVADYTTVYDFRALAHEVGHQLGLVHVSKSNGQLMYQGANGFNLSIEEIEIARENAEFFKK
jgi:hypothetical protein